MVALINGEFEFRGMTFGSSRSGYLLKQDGFEISPLTFITQDQDNPTGDGIVFGRDSLPGAVYSWDLWVIGEESSVGWKDVSKRLSSFKKVWQGSPTRKIPRAVDELKLWHGNEEGLAYGRARNFAPVRAGIRRGHSGILCDFSAVDDLVYSTTLSTHTANLVESSRGGLVAPLIAPLIASSAGSSRSGFFDVGGEAATPAIVRFNGPITSPKITIPGYWTLGLNTTVAYNDWIEVDTRLWKRSVLRKNAASAAGSVMRSSYSLEKLTLTPGTREMIFSGVDPTNTASVTLSWRNARHSV